MPTKKVVKESSVVTPPETTTEKVVVKDEKFYQKRNKQFILTIVLGLVIFFILIPFLTYFYFAPKLTSKEAIMNNNNSGVILLDRNSKPFFSFYQANYKSFVPLNSISSLTQHAVIAVEDKDFYSHPGFSVKSIVRAFFANFSQGEIAQGGSTLTQQLVKNSLLTAQKSIARKYQELVVAEEIERKYSKNEILEMYLNSVYFGEGAFGIGQAAHVYFNKEPKDLSIAESAMLAGLLPSPSRYSPISGDAVLAKQRQGIVLKDMLQQNYITQAQYQAAFKEQLKYNKTKDDLNSFAPHFALMVRDELIKKYGEEEITRSGYQVKTTLNSDWQKYSEKVVSDQVDSLARNKVTNGSAVVIDPKTGQILVMVGSKDWYNESFGKVNMATTPRQPGSSFKPIVYTDALEKNIITAGTVLHDTPKTYPGNYTPHDYDGKTRGDMTLRRALANSLNLPAVEVMSKVGVQSAIDWSKQLGITTLKDSSNYGYSLVLGSAEVPLVEMTNVYATFANKGVHNDPVSILEIKDKQNRVVYTAPNNSQQVVSSAVAYIISSILSDNNAKQETFGNALANNYNAAVKTGTTENYVDALTLGYLPNIAVGVWVGNNDHKPMDSVAGALGPAPIWRTLINHFAAELPREYFVKPASVVSVPICVVVISPTPPADPNVTPSPIPTQVENFVAGTEPKTQCNPTPTVTPASPSPDNTATPPPNQTQAPTVTSTPVPTAVVPTVQPTATPPIITLVPTEGGAQHP